MAQKTNLTPVDKYEADPRVAERLDLEKHAIGSRFSRSGERHSAGANR